MLRTFLLASISLTASAAPPTWKPYGQVEVDLTRDSNESTLGNPPSEPTRNRLWDLSPAPSLVGVALQAQGPWGSELRTRVEADFLGSGGNNLQLRLRHAYVQLEWASGFGLLAGQTYDIASPLQMDTISYPLDSLTGDLGGRRPQIRATQVLGTDRLRWTLQLAGTTLKAKLEKPLDEGASQATLPTGMARFAATAGFREGASATLGLYGHSGRGHFRFQPGAASETLRTWSRGLDLTVGFSPRWILMAEAWEGSTLDLLDDDVPALLLLQQRRGVEMKGGWATLTWKPTPPMRFNLGTGWERIRPEDVPAGGHERIHTSFVNVFYDPLAELELGLEISHWRSNAFLDTPARDKTRVQATLIYKF